MPTEWVTMTALAKECGIHPRTFRNNYLEKWPPEREVGNRRWWKRPKVNEIKRKEFNIPVKDDD